MTQSNDRASWQPLLELAAGEVFEIMVGCKLGPAANPDDAPSSDLTAMVGLAGQLCGVLSIRCSTQAAILMASKMLGVDTDQANSQVWDAVGEICNMIAGNFKSKLAGLGDHCMLSVPTVIRGGDYTFRALSDSGPVEAILMFEGSPIQLSLEVHS